MSNDDPTEDSNESDDESHNEMNVDSDSDSFESDNMNIGSDGSNHESDAEPQAKVTHTGPNSNSVGNDESLPYQFLVPVHRGNDFVGESTSNYLSLGVRRDIIPLRSVFSEQRILKWNQEFHDLRRKFPDDKLEIVTGPVWGQAEITQIKCHDCPDRLYSFQLANTRAIRHHVESVPHANNVACRMMRDGKDTILTDAIRTRNEKLKLRMASWPNTNIGQMWLSAFHAAPISRVQKAAHNADSRNTPIAGPSRVQAHVGVNETGLPSNASSQLQNRAHTVHKRHKPCSVSTDTHISGKKRRCLEQTRPGNLTAPSGSQRAVVPSSPRRARLPIIRGTPDCPNSGRDRRILAFNDPNDDTSQEEITESFKRSIKKLELERVRTKAVVEELQAEVKELKRATDSQEDLVIGFAKNFSDYYQRRIDQLDN
ncbi:hypothetical protein OCU04_001180 [Sclerotinia nivalis]|uniref:Uncharacterized protein n=1 Tax=Sclerotinia nivalis TaxID=352851 RepID=A0A9X0DPH2_9HELO|nr:hypothetical protein OCU04_001180 [Sclerotinia nivalis]